LNRDDPRPEVQNFLKEYETRYKIQPDMVGASAYDAFMIICESIKKAGSLKGPAIRDAIAATKNFNALTGEIKGFDAVGEVVKEVQVQIIKDGRFRHYGVVKEMDLITP
jgi:branched-chain amino acid transport system substrate-binding protein